MTVDKSSKYFPSVTKTHYCVPQETPVESVLNESIFWSYELGHRLFWYLITNFSEKPIASTFRHEGGGSTFLQNVGNHLPDYTVS
jgi:hypothetical protein